MLFYIIFYLYIALFNTYHKRIYMTVPVKKCRDAMFYSFTSWNH